MRALPVFAALALASAVQAQVLEPKYEGRPITYWLEKFQKAENDQERKAAEVAVAAFGPDGAPAVPALTVMLDDRSASYREQVANMLCGIGPGAKAAVPDLIKMLTANPPRGPHQVIRVLCAIGPAAGDAVPAIRRVVRDYFAQTDLEDGPPYLLALPMYKFDKLGAPAVPLLLDLANASTYGRPDALRALRRIGPDARAAAPRLVEFLKDGDVGVRVAAAEALWEVAKDRRAIPVLATALTADDTGAAWTAANALGVIGPPAREALPALRAFLPKDDTGKDDVKGVNPIILLAGGTPTDIGSAHAAARSAIRKIEAKP